MREFDDRPLPDGVLDRIVESAHLTASASNVQPWHFVVVRKREDLQKLGQSIRTGPYVAQAAAAVIVASEKSNPTGLSDTSRAIQSMFLTAWGEGVGSNWTGFAGRLENVREAFGLPESFDVVGVLPFGYPKRKLGLGKKKRKPIGEVVSDEKFGTPWKG
ncbi:MAG TPA: nitroreductase family protein [Candidatus Dormibacteraeota bacterium]|nr:nitroreductase family protein [Candidatus Dormibacteraeota bacterium]